MKSSVKLDISELSKYLYSEEINISRCSDTRGYKSGASSLEIKYRGGITIEIIENQDIVIKEADTMNPIQIKRIILGRALGYLLHIRGRFALHASTVNINNKAVLFAGDSGMGKSTLAASCLDCGHEVLSCDISAFDNTLSHVLPFAPLLKLAEDAYDSITKDLTPAFPHVEGIHKRYYKIDKFFTTKPVEVSNIYALQESDTKSISIEPLSARDAIEVLLEHSYAKPILEETRTTKRNFKRCTSLAKSVPVKRIKRPNDLDRLPEVVRTVEDDLES